MVRAYFVGARATQSVHRPVSVGAQLARFGTFPVGPCRTSPVRLMVLEKAAAAETNKRTVVRRRCVNERRR